MLAPASEKASMFAFAVAVAVAVAVAIAIAHRSYTCITKTNAFEVARSLLALTLRAYNSTTLTILNAERE